jgi:serine/threonine-protein kinase
MDAPGRRIAGKYELIERAGEGGMAAVWRATTLGAQGFARPVALKRALPSLARDPAFIAMFVEEARVSATLDHPNIVHIHDFGMDEDGGYYLVMEWIEGLDLRRFAQAYEGDPIPWPIAVAMLIDVLNGLHAAHTRETDDGDPAPIFHRDVTPQNVLVSVRGVVKLTDFGLARAMDRARTTTPGVVKGKLAYLAPEILNDAPPSVRTDLYGAGIVLWELLAGRKLYDADTDHEVFEKVMRASVPPISRIRADVPAAIGDVLHTALARDPGRRYRDARSMAAVLSRALRQLEEPADAHAISQAVREARDRLGMPTGRRSLEAIEAEGRRRLESLEADAKRAAEVRAALFPNSLEPSGTIPLPLTKKK